MAPIVSIIVPVYNAEPFLRRCIDSIRAQILTDFELILIDDGSVDQSGKVCDEYGVYDSRIKVIHQNNAGASAARNAGIRTAAGKYLAFCDSDDCVSPMWLKRMADLAEDDTMPAGVCCDCVELLGRRKENALKEGKKVSLNRYCSFGRNGISAFVVTALFQRKLVIQKELFFREQKQKGDYNEDLIFILSYAKCISNVAYTGYADYFYDKHSKSLSNSYQRYTFDKYEEKYFLWKDFFECKRPSNEAELMKQIAASSLYQFLLSVQMEVNISTFGTSVKQYKKFKRMVCADAMQQCVRIADTISENRFIIEKIKKKNCFILWLYYLLVNIKEKKR